MTRPILINFNVPIDTRNRFDMICHAGGKTRTSVLIELMTNYVLEEGKRLIERQKEFGVFDQSFRESKDLKVFSNSSDLDYHNSRSARQTWGDDDFDLPSPILSDGQERW